jgi:hypothetical protein
LANRCIFLSFNIILSIPMSNIATMSCCIYIFYSLKINMCFSFYQTTHCWQVLYNSNNTASSIGTIAGWG